MKKKMHEGGWLKRVLYITVALIVLILLLYTAAWTLTLGDYKVARTVADDSSLPVIEVNGYRFHGETFGKPSNPLVIVIHGGPGWDYRSLLPLKALADNYHVVFYDQRGAGLSPRVEAARLSLETSLADLDAIVERFRSGKEVILIGHSWGAMLAAAYLGQFPEKVSHAVLAEPGFLNTELLTLSGLRMGPRLEAAYLWFAGRKWFESLHIDGPDSEAAKDYFMAAAAGYANPEYYCNNTIPEAGKLLWRAGATAMGTMLQSAQDEHGTLQFDITAGLKRFNRPVLLLASECNRYIGVEQQQRHVHYFHEVELKVIEQSGHMIFGEQPEAALAVVREYLGNGM